MAVDTTCRDKHVALIQCRYATVFASLVGQLEKGGSLVECKLDTLKVAHMILDVLACWNPSATLTCITEDEFCDLTDFIYNRLLPETC